MENYTQRDNLIYIELTLDDGNTLSYYAKNDVVSDRLKNSYEYLGIKIKYPKLLDEKELDRAIEKDIINYLSLKERYYKCKDKLEQDKSKLERDRKRLDEEIEKFQDKKLKFIKDRDSRKSDSDSEEILPKKKKK